VANPREFKDERVFMNTVVRIRVVTTEPTVMTLNDIDSAFGQFDAVVMKFTRFNDSSELAHLNQNSGKEFRVSPELFMLAETMLTIAELSGGAYDPTIIDLLEAYGYDKNSNFSKLDKAELFQEIKAITAHRAGFNEIKLDKKKLTIKLIKGQRLDLGSIGKGYAIDLAAGILQKHQGFIINAGGDIRAKGKNKDGNYWKVGLLKTAPPNSKITDPGSFGYVLLKDSSVAGSGGWARKVGFFHHLLNPKSGLPINEVSQTYITGPDATQTDAWSTALFAMGAAGLEVMQKNTSLEGLIVMSNGDIKTTKGFNYFPE
jgi:thiamine biosynthesis lipoprotein